MNKQEFAEYLAEKIGEGESADKSKEILRTSEKCVDIFFDSIKDALLRGDRIELRGLGSFTLKTYPPYTGRNPKTGERIQVKEKRLPVFRTSKNLKARLNPELK